LVNNNFSAPIVFPILLINRISLETNDFAKLVVKLDPKLLKTTMGLCFLQNLIKLITERLALELFNVKTSIDDGTSFNNCPFFSPNNRTKLELGLLLLHSINKY